MDSKSWDIVRMLKTLKAIRGESASSVGEIARWTGNSYGVVDRRLAEMRKLKFVARKRVAYKSGWRWLYWVTPEGIEAFLDL